MRMMTIKEAAAQPDCPLKEWAIRHYVKLNEFPHFMRGNRAYIDLDALIAWTQKRMLDSVKGVN